VEYHEGDVCCAEETPRQDDKDAVSERSVAEVEDDLAQEDAVFEQAHEHEPICD